MKTKMWMALLMVAGGTWGSAVVPAANAQESAKPAGGLAEQIADLDLNNDQDNKISEIRKEYRPKVQEAARGLDAVVMEELGKVRAILTPEQIKKVDEMKDERQERRTDSLAQRIAHAGEFDLTDAEIAKIQDIRKSYHPRIEKNMKELGNILTDQQKQTREQGLSSGLSRREIIASLNLTDEQKPKVTAIAKEVKSLVREETDKMRDVLTDEQKVKLASQKDERAERIRDRRVQRIANFRELNLTEAQRTQIAEIRKEYRPRLHDADNKLRAVIRQELVEIVGVLKV
jgi:Spy/CpxP family protein refolding chaperone